MSNELAPIKNLLSEDSVQKKIREVVGKKSEIFTSSIVQIVGNNKLLAKSDPKTVLNACITATTLDLPINQNLGFAWIVPYKGQAQFQIGWKGFVQLALRTQQYERINVVDVYENQFKGYNSLTEEFEGDFSLEGQGEVVGYACYFKLKNGFEKFSYWSKQKVTQHAKKYSQSFGKSFSPWADKDQFNAMARKTVLKNTLSKWGIMSIQMQDAITFDQSVQHEQGKAEYIDNQVEDVEVVSENEEERRIEQFIDKATTIKELESLESFANEKQIEKINILKEKMKTNGTNNETNEEI